MNTCVLMLLCSLGVVPDAAGTTWLSDYGRALELSRSERAPLLVVIHEPTDRTHRLDQAPPAIIPASAPARVPAGSLLGNYVLCAVDASTPYGQKVARAFKVVEYPYTVIIDRTASVQLFHKSGALSTEEWQTTLASHKSGRRTMVVQAESHHEPAFCST